jgi:hypothetical protein
VKDKYYYEIPVAELGKDFLWVQQIARTTLGVGYGGQPSATASSAGNAADDKILLREVQLRYRRRPPRPHRQSRRRR